MTKAEAKSILYDLIDKSDEIFVRDRFSMNQEIFNFHVKAAMKVVNDTEGGGSYADD